MEGTTPIHISLTNLLWCSLFQRMTVRKSKGSWNRMILQPWHENENVYAPATTVTLYCIHQQVSYQHLKNSFFFHSHERQMTIKQLCHMNMNAVILFLFFVFFFLVWKFVEQIQHVFRKQNGCQHWQTSFAHTLGYLNSEVISALVSLEKDLWFRSSQKCTNFSVSHDKDLWFRSSQKCTNHSVPHDKDLWFRSSQKCTNHSVSHDKDCGSNPANVDITTISIS